MNHAHFLHRCLALAERGRGCTGINPMVGAVLVRDGKIIAEAWHEAFGGAHAEAQLIKKLDQKILQQDGLYVNLEPCCHSGKKTPPCCKSIVESGIRHVIIGMLDPNPAVAGKGITELRKHGITVEGPAERARCEWLNRGYLSLMTKSRPWISLKMAQIPDGAIAHEDGTKMKITTAEQDRWSHRFLRAKHDAILVGVGTITSDDSQLTVRNVECGMSNIDVIPHSTFRIPHSPLRIILDPHLRIPLSAKVVSGEMAGGTVVIRKEFEKSEESEESKEKLFQLRARGIRVIAIPVDAYGIFDWAALWRVLTTPEGDFHGIRSILVEGGQRTWNAFRDAGMVDCVVTLVGGGT